MLNSPAPAAVKTPSPRSKPVTTSPKHDSNSDLKPRVDEVSQTLSSSKCTSEKISGKSRTSRKSDETKSSNHNSSSAGQKNSIQRRQSESKESLPDTKIRIKLDTENNNDVFRVKNDSKPKSENKKRTESEGKEAEEVNLVKDVEDSVESNLKDLSKTDVKLKKSINGIVKVKKTCKSLEGKVEKVKQNDKKLDQPIVQKKTKRKHNESGKQSKDTSDAQSSKEKTSVSIDKTEVQSTEEKLVEPLRKDTNRPKSGNKDKKKSDRTESFGFDCAEDDGEDSVVDVVGGISPALKKKKMESSVKPNGVNGIHKNGHVDMPLSIQLAHDKGKDPTSLIVKIPLSFLSRIPDRFGGNLTVSLLPLPLFIIIVFLVWLYIQLRHLMIFRDELGSSLIYVSKQEHFSDFAHLYYPHSIQLHSFSVSIV